MNTVILDLDNLIRFILDFVTSPVRPQIEKLTGYARLTGPIMEVFRVALCVVLPTKR